MNLPPEYDTPEIKESLKDWAQHYKEREKKPWSSVSAKRTINWFAKRNYSAAHFLDALDYSIRKGYRGVFPDPDSKKQVEWTPDTRTVSSMTDEQRLARYMVANEIEEAN